MVEFEARPQYTPTCIWVGRIQKEEDMIRLKDKLSHLSYTQACKFLGPQKEQSSSGKAGDMKFDLTEQVKLTGDLFPAPLGPVRRYYENGLFKAPTAPL